MKKLDPELLRAMMMGDYSPTENNDLKDDWVNNDLHSKKKEKPNQNFETLTSQLAKCERVLEKAIVANKKEVAIIHGKGKGVLKQQVHQLLKKHAQVRSFELDKNNFGQTIVKLK